MKLYFHPMSGNSRRALLVAAHLAVPLERIVVNLPEGEQRGATHLARNPNGRVPVLDDDGFLLWESRAIMVYLAEQTPNQTLWPSEPRARADVNRWLLWCAAHMAPAQALSRPKTGTSRVKGATSDALCWRSSRLQPAKQTVVDSRPI